MVQRNTGQLASLVRFEVVVFLAGLNSVSSQSGNSQRIIQVNLLNHSNISEHEYEGSFLIHQKTFQAVQYYFVCIPVPVSFCVLPAVETNVPMAE